MGNRKLATEIAASSELRGVATTAVAMLIDGQVGTLAHVGDSRVYQLRKGQLEQLTRDHSWVEELLQVAAPTEAAALVHPWRHIVTPALSGSEDLEVDLQELPLESGVRSLLCSDGVFTVLADGQIADVFRREADRDEACQAVVRGTNEGGGPDDATAVVVEVDAV